MSAPPIPDAVFRLPASPLRTHPGTGADSLALPSVCAAAEVAVAGLPLPPPPPSAPVEIILAAPAQPRLLWG